jgi:MraZ protein
MDEKGRVALPAAFRREADGGALVLFHGWDDAHLTLAPPVVWTELQGRLLEARRSDPVLANAVRRLLAEATEVVPDKQGRILVPSALQAAAGLSGPVLMHGNIDRVELWSPERFRSSVAQVDEVDRDELSRLKTRLLL